VTAKDALLLAAVFRAGQRTPPGPGTGETDVVMCAIGLAHRDRARAILAEHLGEDAAYAWLEELGEEVGITIAALRPDEQDPRDGD
jgi:hypothetical protein